MKINNCLTLYDYYIVNSLEKRLSNNNIKNLKFLYSPTDLCFYFAKEKWGEKILPFYNVWRNEAPKMTPDATSLVNYNTRIKVDNDISVRFLLLLFTYQIDFFSNNMYDMNEMVMDYYKVKSSPYIEVNLNDIGLDVNYMAEVNVDEITSNNVINEMFEKGRYFRYSFSLNTRLILIHKLENVKLDKIKFSFFEYGYGKIIEMEKEIKK